jgi:hypothetical protein
MKLRKTRFLTRDVCVDCGGIGSSRAALYLYAAGNPIDKYDPEGRVGLDGLGGFYEDIAIGATVLGKGSSPGLLTAAAAIFTGGSRLFGKLIFDTDVLKNEFAGAYATNFHFRDAVGDINGAANKSIEFLNYTHRPADEFLGKTDPNTDPVTVKIDARYIQGQGSQATNPTVQDVIVHEVTHVWDLVLDPVVFGTGEPNHNEDERRACAREDWHRTHVEFLPLEPAITSRRVLHLPMRAHGAPSFEVHRSEEETLNDEAGTLIGWSDSVHTSCAD